MKPEVCDYNKSLIHAIEEKLNGKHSLSFFLADILCIGEGSAYRRIRGEVPFTFEEAIILSKQLNISLDEIINNTERIKHFRVCLANYNNPQEADYEILQKYVYIINGAKDDPHSRMMVLTNSLPQAIYLQYKKMFAFFLFKWGLYNTPSPPKAFHEIIIPDRMQDIFKKSLSAQMQFNTTEYIFDKDIFLSLINEIKYFASIGLIKTQDVKNLRKEMHEILCYIENIAVSGKYENKKAAYIYISETRLKECYRSIKIKEHFISIMDTYLLNEAAATDQKSYEKINNWIYAKRQQSTLITQCADIQRIAFFDQQQLALANMF